MVERVSMADGQSPEINSNLPQPSTEPNVVVSSEQKAKSGPRRLLGRLLGDKDSQPRILVKPGGSNEFSDDDRLATARQVLSQTELTLVQKEEGFDEGAILRAHNEALGELGKDNEEASIGNYRKGQLLRKARELKKGGYTEEQRRALMESGVTGLDVPDYLKEARRSASRFEQLAKWMEENDDSQIDVTMLTPDQLRSYNQSRLENLEEMGRIIEEAQSSGVLNFLIQDIRRIYTEVAPDSESSASPRRRRSSSVYGERAAEPSPKPKSIDERIDDVRKILGDYQETFWEEGSATWAAVTGLTKTSALKQAYKGVAKYIASRVAIAIETDLKRRPLDPNNEIGDEILSGIKTQIREETRRAQEAAEIARQRQRRNATPKEMLPYNDWREKFDFTWAETPEELERTVFAWLEKFETHLPDAASDEVHQEGNSWKQNAINALEKAAIDLEISEKDPFYIRLKYTIEAYVSVLAGVKIQESDGGFEGFTTYLEAFAYQFNGHHDAIYLGNAKSAIMQAYLSRNHGEIALGASRTTEKPLGGEIRAFRESIEEDAIEYAATHELYIKKGDFDRRLSESNAGYAWEDEDVIAELLLVDSRGMAEAMALPNATAQAEAIVRVATRTAVFKKIKKRLESEDMYEDTPGHFVSLASLSPDQRQDVIRMRIIDKIRKAGNGKFADDISAMTDPVAKDKELWDWLKDYNQRREKNGDTLWFPSAWDTVRLSINTSTKLVDRALSADELDSMIEKVKPLRVQIGTRGYIDVDTEGLTEEQIKEDIQSRLGLTDAEKEEALEDVLFDVRQRKSESTRAFSINRNYQKFLGLDARWGGLVSREVGDRGVTELRTIYEMAEELLKAKIDLEEKEIEEKVEAYERTLVAKGKTAEEIAVLKIEKRRLERRDSTFGATLALRELGIANDLPIWNYDYFNDPKLVQAVAPYLGYTHGDKPDIAQLLDRGRREMRAVFDHLAEKHMDGRILVVRDRPDLVVDSNTGELKPFHEEKWDRPRVINDAGEMDLRNIFESRFMISTSGGVEVVDLISKIADLGVYDLLWEMGCKDFREFQGFIKRRDEHELSRQSFWNTKKWRDPISYAKRLRGAGAAKVYLTGGKTKQGEVTGNLIEPMSGAYKLRDQFFNSKHLWHFSNEDPEYKTYIEVKDGDEVISVHFKEKVKQLLENADLHHINPLRLDQLIEIGAGILKPLLDYLNARDYVMNRGGRTPKNWKLDNELIVDAYLEEMSKDTGAFGPRQGAYAPQGRSETAKAIYRTILQTSTYHTLSEKDRRELDFDDIVEEDTKDRSGKVIKKGDVKKGIITRAKERVAEKRAEITARPLPANIQSLIDERRKVLEGLNTHENHSTKGRPNLELELERIKQDYIETQLRKETVGEWPARFTALSIKQSAHH